MKLVDGSSDVAPMSLGASEPKRSRTLKYFITEEEEEDQSLLLDI